MAYLGGQRLCAFLTLAAFCACGNTATISRNYGPAYEAEITGSDAQSLRVRDDRGYEFAIPKEDVADIDHPGNVLFAVGAATLASFSPLFIKALSNRGNDDYPGLTYMFLFSIGVPCISMIAAGIVPYVRSKRAAGAFEDANPVLPVPRTVPMYPYPPPGYPTVAPPTASPAPAYPAPPASPPSPASAPAPYSPPTP